MANIEMGIKTPSDCLILVRSLFLVTELNYALRRLKLLLITSARCSRDLLLSLLVDLHRIRDQEIVTVEGDVRSLGVRVSLKFVSAAERNQWTQSTVILTVRNISCEIYPSKAAVGLYEHWING